MSKKRYKIFNKTLNKYSREISYKFGEENGYQRSIFSKKQARQYIKAINWVLVNELHKDPYEFKLEEVKE